MTELQSGTRLQSSLGTNLKRETGNYIVDSLIIARVTGINYQYNTVDFQPMVNTSAGYKAAQGGNTAVLPMTSAGRNGYGRAYGETQPIVVGDLLLIGYIEGNNTSPIVIARYPDQNIAKEVSTQSSPTYAADDTDSFDKSHQKIKVRPDLTYDLEGGTGRRELTFSGNTFMLINPDVPQMSHATDDGEMPANSKSLDGYMDGNNSYRTPLNRKAPEIIFGHNGTVTDDGTTVDQHEFYLYLAQDGTYRTSIMQDNQDWRAYFEQTSDGKVRLRRQEDSKIFGSGSKSSEVGIDENGYVTIRSQTTGFLIKPDGIYNADGTKLSLTMDTSQIENNLNNKLDKALAGFDNKIAEGNKTLEVQIGVFKDELSTKVSEDTLLDTMSSQLKSYQDKLAKNQAMISQYEDAIKSFASDGHITADEMATVKTMWSDLAAAYPILQEQAKKYAVDTTALDTTYDALNKYITPIIAGGDAIIDTAEFTTYWNSYLSNDSSVNQAVYDAIVKVLVPASSEAIQHLETSINQNKEAIDQQAQRITNQDDTITKTQGEIKLMADNIKLSLSQTTSSSAAATHKQMYGLTLGNVNLFAKLNAVKNNTLDVSTGKQVTTPGGFASEYIVVDPSIHYTISTTDTQGNTIVSYAFYDSQKTFISGDSKTSDQDITIAGITPPTGAAYIVVSVNNDTKVMLERGSVKHTYVQAYEDAAAANALDPLTALVQQENANANTAFKAAKNDADTVPGKLSAILIDGSLSADATTQLQSYLKSWTETLADDNNTAEVYGVDNTAYQSAFNQLSDYLTGVLADPTTLDASKLNGLISTYYTARETFTNSVLGATSGNLSVQLGGISSTMKAAQEAAEAAQSKADSASASASAAQKDAESSNKLITDLTDDDKLSPIEKQTVATELATIKANKTVDNAQATAYSVDSTAYNNAEVAVETMLNPYMVDVSVSSDVDRDTYRQTFATYYTERTNLLNAVANAAKAAADDAVSQAKDAVNGLSNYKQVVSKQFSDISEDLDKVTISVGDAKTVALKATSDLSDSLDKTIEAMNTANKSRDDRISDLTTTANDAKTAADTASSDASSAKSVATKAQTDTQALSTAMENIGSDGKLTPIEKQTVSTELSTIKANLTTDTDQAKKYAVDYTTYTTAETAVEKLLNPLLIDLTTSSDIDRNNYKTVLNVYYTARTDLLNAVADATNTTAQAAVDKADAVNKALDEAKQSTQEKIDAANKAASDAKTTAENAKTAANDASESAQKIQDSLDSIGSDGRVTPIEKQTIATEFSTITTNLPVDKAQATKYGVSYTDYATAESGLSAIITPILSDMTTASVIVRDDYKTALSGYYTARTALLNAIADATQDAATNAADAAKAAQKTADSNKEDTDAKIKTLQDESQSVRDVADAAKADATTAKAAATKAAQEATDIQASLDSIGSDGKLTPIEKQTIAVDLNNMKTNLTNDIAQAQKYSLATTSYVEAESNLEAFLSPLLADMTTASNIDRDTYKADLSTYYTARAALLNAVADKANTTATNAVDAVAKVDDKVNNLSFDNTNLLETSKAIPGWIDLTGTIQGGDGVSADKWKMFMSGEDPDSAGINDDHNTTTTTTTSSTTTTVDNGTPDMSAGLTTDTESSPDGVDIGVDPNTYTNYTMLGLIDTIPGEYLTFHQFDPTDIATHHFHYVWYNSDKGVITGGENKTNLFTTTVPDGAVYLAVSYSSNGNSKVERGKSATAWSVAPNDVTNSLDAMESNTDSRLNNLENNTTDDAMANAVLSNPLFAAFSDANDADKSALSDAISSLDNANQATLAHLTQVETLANGTKTTVNTLVTVTNDMQTVTTNVQNYMTFDNTGLTIGKSDSPFSINISNKQISFQDSGKTIAYISGQKMYIADVKITSGITLGRHRISSYDESNTGITYAGSADEM